MAWVLCCGEVRFVSETGKLSTGRVSTRSVNGSLPGHVQRAGRVSPGTKEVLSGRIEREPHVELVG